MVSTITHIAYIGGSFIVKSLAEHFLSGELSTELLRDGTDEEITKALIAVRGIGQVSLDILCIVDAAVDRRHVSDLFATTS